MTTPHEIALLRLAAQRLAGPALPSAADAVRWLTAMQAQDFNGALTSVALRTAGGSRDMVEAALDDGEIVRSWPMRGTLHLVAAEDLPWMLALTAPRVLAGAARRRAQLELDEATLERARDLAVAALGGGRELRRDDLLAVWRDGGLTTTGQRGYHMLWHLAHLGTLCFGPVRGGDQRIVLLDEWIRKPRRLAGEEALGELALRYFRGHGPATVKDLARWASLTLTDARAGAALARPRLARLDVDGVEHLMHPRTPEVLDACRGRARGVFLLPGFDEYLLGYGDRGAMLPPEHADRIVPGGNGMFKPTVVSDGRVVGTWRHNGRGTKRAVQATPFETFSGEVVEAIAQVYATLP
ncbi:MAG TPA: winged helix DNA-binding domain-containing protein [Micromonosporaceae bacterium]